MKSTQQTHIEKTLMSKGWQGTNRNKKGPAFKKFFFIGSGFVMGIAVGGPS